MNETVPSLFDTSPIRTKPPDTSDLVTIPGHTDRLILAAITGLFLSADGGETDWSSDPQVRASQVKSMKY